MSQQSRISAEIPSKIIDEVLGLLKNASNILKPYLASLTMQDRQYIAKMSDKTVAFVTKIIDYSETNADFNPAYLDIPELKRDFKLVHDLKKIEELAKQLASDIDDTMMLAGSEAYLSSLLYYNNVKVAAKQGLAQAKPIYEDLSVRFPGRSHK